MSGAAPGSPQPPTDAGNKACIRCGTGFECGGALGKDTCWCAELPPVMAVTDEGCLCPACLRVEVEARLARAGLCATCSNVDRFRTRGGTLVYRCTLSREDPAFPKYPRLPVKDCEGFLY